MAVYSKNVYSDLLRFLNDVLVVIVGYASDVILLICASRVKFSVICITRSFSLVTVR